VWGLSTPSAIRRVSPQTAVLLGKRHKATVEKGPRRAPGVMEHHERKQAGDLLMVDPGR
jgi:hypothetical protein